MMMSVPSCRRQLPPNPQEVEAYEVIRETGRCLILSHSPTLPPSPTLRRLSAVTKGWQTGFKSSVVVVVAVVVGCGGGGGFLRCRSRDDRRLPDARCRGLFYFVFLLSSAPAKQPTFLDKHPNAHWLMQTKERPINKNKKKDISKSTCEDQPGGGSSTSFPIIWLQDWWHCPLSVAAANNWQQP